VGLGLHPEAAPGDGARLSATLEDAAGTLRRPLFQALAADARWAELEVDVVVPPTGGRLVLTADAGAAGDARNDWLCVRPTWLGGAGPSVLAAHRASAQGQQAVPIPSTIVMVSVDTLRADAVSFGGHPWRPSPFLDRLAQHGTVFAQAYAPSSWTPPSMASLFTSLHLSSHGVVSGATAGADQVTGVVLPDQLQTLAEALQSAGYTTIGVAASRHLGRRLGFAQGFDHYYEIADFLDARQLNEQVRVQMERAFGARWRTEWKRHRTFLWIHYFDPHDPYAAHMPWIDAYAPQYRQDPAPYMADLPMAELAKLFLPSGDRPSFGPRLWPVYASEVSYKDAMFRRLCAELGVDDDVLLVLTADHGEEMVDHGALGHAFTLYEELIRVPLLVHWPRALPSGRVVDQPAGLLDVYPTLLDLLGIPAPAELQGRSLAAALRGAGTGGPRPMLAELRAPKPAMNALRDGVWKLIRTEAPPHSALYRLDRDPAERHDLSGQHPDVLQRLEAQLRRVLAALPPPPPVQQVVIDDPELREQLESMQYLGN
jgi:arylsulfatase A-like enzyme